MLFFRCKQQRGEKIIHESLNDFEGFLKDIDVEFIKTDIDWRLVHQFCLNYNLETPDAIHVHLASKKSDYLTTIDSGLKKSSIKEVNVLDPANLLGKRELRFKK